MFYNRTIRWLVKFPAPYALGLLWWLEVTVLMCSIAGASLWSNFLFLNIKISREAWLFPLAQATYLLVFYILHFEFARTSQLMESLMHIHRMGGAELMDRLYKLALKESKEAQKEAPLGEKEVPSKPEIPDPFRAPDRIRASAGPFRIRYFIVLPTAAILYLFGFASTIYRIFARQLLAWDPGQVVVPALAAVAVSTACYWYLMPYLPGYVSVRRMLGYKPPEGE